MPHMNTCDLAVFPSMSHRHTALTRRSGGSVASKDTIWRAAETVWKEMPACKVARSFVLAWRLASVVIKKKGANTFLNTKDVHQRVTQDFHDTATGVCPRK